MGPGSSPAANCLAQGPHETTERAGGALIVGCTAAIAAQTPSPPERSAGQNRAPLTAEQQEAQRARESAAAPDAVRPIDILDTVWIEEQTWMETRDAIKAGRTTAIIGTGGLEQNGPYNANGKHNDVLRATCEATARKLGNDTAAALTAKWVGSPARVHFVPEYYDEDKWSFEFLKSIGIHQQPDIQSATRYDIHDDYHYEALVALIDPKLIRPE